MRYYEIINESSNDSYFEIVDLISDWLQGSGDLMDASDFNQIIGCDLAQQCKKAQSGEIFRAVNLPYNKACILVKTGKVTMEPINDRSFVAYSYSYESAMNAAYDYDPHDMITVCATREMRTSDLILDLTQLINILHESDYQIDSMGSVEHEVWMNATEYYTTMTRADFTDNDWNNIVDKCR